MAKHLLAKIMLKEKIVVWADYQVLDLYINRVSWKGSKGKNKKDVKKKGTDLYALLGLKNERFTATPKQLKDCELKQPGSSSILLCFVRHVMLQRVICLSTSV
jgi:hypothetical protein